MSDTTIAPTPEVTTDPATTEDATAITEHTGIADAKKYRRRAQEAEGERDTLRSQVEGLQQQLLGQYLAGHTRKLQEGEDFLTATGLALADVLTEDGQVDQAKVDAALETLEAERPYLLQIQPKANVTFGQGQRERTSQGMTWAKALKG